LPTRVNHFQKKSDESLKTVTNIPYELLEFVRRDTYSLLIKGYAGTGKTTLSLTILRTLKIRHNFFYISTRLSPRQLFLHYQWLGRYVDSTPDQKESSSSRQPSSYDISSFEDARLDEPESLFERITNQLMDVKAPVIIIDSWDAIASFMDKEARLNNERVLQTWRERAGAKLIFISEDPADPTLDFLVDGIVQLNNKLFGDVKVREIVLAKLRGIRIRKSSYVFTLDNALFQSYNPYDPAEFMPADSHENDYDTDRRGDRRRKPMAPLTKSLANIDFVPSGYAQLDESFGGGFPKKSVVLIESDSNVHAGVTMTLLANMIANVTKIGNPVIIEPFMTIDAKTIMKYLKPYLQTGFKRDLLRIFSSDRPRNAEALSSDYATSQKDNASISRKHMRYYREFVLKTRQKYPHRLLLTIVSAEMFRTTYHLSEGNTVDLLSFLNVNSDLTLIPASSSHCEELNLPEMANLNLRLSTINGTLILRSISPETCPFAIVTQGYQGPPSVRLEPLV
jgi:KaiC/GvpD/RAD55 family RecA-like ATPase